jgi:hypothetical protein
MRGTVTDRSFGILTLNDEAPVSKTGSLKPALSAMVAMLLAMQAPLGAESPSGSSAPPTVLLPEQVDQLVEKLGRIDPQATLDSLIVEGMVRLERSRLIVNSLTFREGAKLIFVVPVEDNQPEIILAVGKMTTQIGAQPATITWEPKQSRDQTPITPASTVQVAKGADRQTGGPGARGGKGAKGRPGRRGPRMYLFVQATSGTLPLIRLEGEPGAKGGTGGIGGRGGVGADGDSAKQSLLGCLAVATSGGAGGDGGNGGDGGDGGDAGDGGQLVVVMPRDTSDQLLSRLSVDVSGGIGGPGGDGGNGGEPGTPGEPGRGAEPVCPGSATRASLGAPGQPGISGTYGKNGGDGNLMIGFAEARDFARAGLNRGKYNCSFLGWGCSYTTTEQQSELGASNAWIIVTGSFSSLEGAKQRNNDSTQFGMSPSRVFMRNGYYASAILESDLAKAQSDLRIMKEEQQDAYIAPLRSWCENPRATDAFIACGPN